MDKKEFIELLFTQGKQAGFEDMEVYISSSNELEIMVFKGEISNYSISDEEGLSFRGLYNGKMGYSYTEKIDKSSIELLINEAIDNSKIIDSNDEEYIFQGSDKYEQVNNYNEKSEAVPTENKIDFVMKMEEEGLRIDNRVDTIGYCLLSDSNNSTMIVNTKGLNLESKSNQYIAYISAVIKEDDDVKTGAKYEITNCFNDLNGKTLAKHAIDEGISMLGAKSIESGDYPVILRGDVSANILKTFAVIFSADNVNKDVSLLKGKVSKQVASPIVTLVDDPFMENGVFTRAFDAEGVASQKKKVINKGILTTYLHNLKTANKDNIQSTGNAYKSSYKSPIDIAPTNMYIEKGDVSFDDMVKSIEKGLIIINVQGLHSGLNTISGDFSLSAYGYEIIDGEINRPVNQITISGNYFNLLKDIEQISDDLKFTMPGYGYIGSPSIKIKSLSVAGE
ncbi:MAG: TldD/PmbA family protein [Vallitalea sp.]|jgi:PmbA protein|nr:TldD/PmbA family protein [Vallitalea sp.]